MLSVVSPKGPFGKSWWFVFALRLHLLGKKGHSTFKDVQTKSSFTFKDSAVYICTKPTDSTFWFKLKKYETIANVMMTSLMVSQLLFMTPVAYRRPTAFKHLRSFRALATNLAYELLRSVALVTGSIKLFSYLATSCGVPRLLIVFKTLLALAILACSNRISCKRLSH